MADALTILWWVLGIGVVVALPLLRIRLLRRRGQPVTARHLIAPPWRLHEAEDYQRRE